MAATRKLVVIASFDSPGSDPRGLAWDGTYLWNVDKGTQTVYRLDSTDGTIISSFSAPDNFPTGLTWQGNSLWLVAQADQKIYGYDAAGNELSNFTIVTGTGLAWDGTYLWLMRGGIGNVLSYTTSGTNIGFINCGATIEQGLTWDGTEFWLSASGTGEFHRLSTGGIIEEDFYIPTIIGESSQYAQGMTWDGTYLWYADSRYNKIYKIEIYFPGLTALEAEPGAPVWIYQANINNSILYESTIADGEGVAILEELVGHPSAWIQSGGRRYVAFYRDGDCEYIYYDEDTWSDPVTIRADRTDPAAIPLPASRDVMIVCKDSSDNFYLNMLRWNGTSYTVETEIDMSTTGNQTGDGWVQAGGMVYLAYTDTNDDLQTISSTLEGAAWS